jgi:WD40 repeat protein
VLATPGDPATTFAFTPDGRWLLAAFNNGDVRAFPMRAGDEPHTISPVRSQWRNVVAVAPSGRQAAVGLNRGRLLLIDLESGRSQALSGFPESSAIGAVAFSENGRLLAAASGTGPRDDKVIRLFDLQSGTTRTFGPLPGAGNGRVGAARTLAFVGAGRILALLEGAGVVSVDLQSGDSKVIASQPNARLQLATGGSSGVGLEASEAGGTTSVIPFRMDRRALPPLRGYENPRELALDTSGTVVATGGVDGTVRIGRVTGGDPHILVGHRGPIIALAFSPDGRWLASAATDDTIRIWPVPDVSRTPLHKLPHEDLLTRLRSYTNLRAVPDESAMGYALKPGPFPGWATPPIE